MTTPRPPDEVFCMTSCAAIAEHQRFAAWLRAHIQPCYDTGALAPDETAGQIAAWVRRRMLG